MLSFFFFFNDTATTEIYTLSLHDALPIFWSFPYYLLGAAIAGIVELLDKKTRSEEHTSELQSRLHLVCRLLLEKKKQGNQCQTSQCHNQSYAIEPLYRWLSPPANTSETIS